MGALRAEVVVLGIILFSFYFLPSKLLSFYFLPSEVSPKLSRDIILLFFIVQARPSETKRNSLAPRNESSMMM